MLESITLANANAASQKDNSTVFYAGSTEHVLDELERIDQIVSDSVRRWRKTSRNQTFPGLVISEEEIDSILAKEPSVDGSEAEAETKRQATAERISVKKAESMRNGVELRLEVLKELFGLDGFEVDALLVALASELDSKYEKLFAYLQDDVTKKHPTVGLILCLFFKNKKDQAAARQHFTYNAPLVRNFILHLQEGDVPLLEKTLKLDDHIVGFLLGSSEMDPAVASFSTLKPAENGFENLNLPESLKQQLTAFASNLQNPKPVLILQGSFELQELAQAICHQTNNPVLSADLEKLKNENPSESLRFLFREAKLQNAAVYLDKFEVAADETKRAALDELDLFDGLSFVSAKTPLALKRRQFVIAVPQPKFVDRLKMWRELAGDVPGIEDVAVRFKFGRAKAQAAVEAAKSMALLRDPKSPSLTVRDLYAGCRAQLNPVSHAAKISPLYKWDDIVLPPDKKEQLLEVCNYVKNYPTVYESWGFDKHSRGKGLNVLFSGPSGTGKTMAAEIVAGELGLDMYKIDLSMVVSKYIGETEKNLNQIFKDAEDANAVLFFDEADALFGKRSEVKDAHDRYANIEINYLLQKMEEHEGIVVLATNMQRNVDDAFLRRMNFIVEFPFPSDEYRLAIWKKVFPPQTPTDAIDYKFLSELQISGGNIKNIALTAAFLAAEEGGKVQMSHVMRAAKREFQKIGKVFGKEEPIKK